MGERSTSLGQMPNRRGQHKVYSSIVQTIEIRMYHISFIIVAYNSTKMYFINQNIENAEKS